MRLRPARSMAASAATTPRAAVGLCSLAVTIDLFRLPNAPVTPAELLDNSELSFGASGGCERKIFVRAGRIACRATRALVRNAVFAAREAAGSPAGPRQSRRPCLRMGLCFGRAGSVRREQVTQTMTISSRPGCTAGPARVTRNNADLLPRKRCAAAPPKLHAENQRKEAPAR